MSLATPHPYFPLDSHLPGYVANDWNVGPILLIFSAVVVLVGITANGLLQARKPGSSTQDRLLTIWFAISAAIHLLVEGYFSINQHHMPELQDFLGQAWKEYSKSDSRYLTSEPFVVCMESVTAFAWGPLCLLTAWMIITGSPWRHSVQALVSTGQLYGVLLYFATNLFEVHYKGLSYSRPELLYYWGYYVGLNTIWCVIPSYCIYSSMIETSRAFSKLDLLQESADSKVHLRNLG